MNNSSFCVRAPFLISRESKNQRELAGCSYMPISVWFLTLFGFGLWSKSRAWLVAMHWAFVKRCCCAGSREWSWKLSERRWETWLFLELQPKRTGPFSHQIICHGRSHVFVICFRLSFSILFHFLHKVFVCLLKSYGSVDFRWPMLSFKYIHDAWYDHIYPISSHIYCVRIRLYMAYVC